MMFIASVSMLLVACGGNKHKTLGGLKYVPEEEKEIEFESLGHAEVRQEYKELLDLFEDEKLKEQIERRIADVYMIEGEYDQAEVAERSSYYVDAIKAYRGILEKYPNSPDNAEVLYQLSKAYDLEGQQEEAMKMLVELTTRHSTYPNIAEAYFRKGDIYFSWEKYLEAEDAYRSVTETGEVKYLLNAHYMLGWTKYKRARFRTAFESFSYVLDQLLDSSENLDALDKTSRPVAEDAIHSMSLALDKIGGAESLQTFDGLDQKPYIWLVYEHLGEFYLEKELYEQSAQTFRVFLDGNPTALRAPQFHNRLIATYTKGGFPKQALTEKEAFVKEYGIYSSYFQSIGIDDDAKNAIKLYLDELARHNYSQGTETTKKIASFKGLKNIDAKKLKIAEEQEKEFYISAANFYGELIETFPEDERVDEVVFLQAEALFLAQEYAKSIPGYERVAYTPHGNSAVEQAADSGYAAIISYQRYIETLSSNVDAQKEWQSNAVESMLKFAEKFHTDERSPTVLTNSAEYLFSLNRYERALEVAGNLIASNKSLDPELKKTAYGIMAHSQFKLEDYVSAQLSYLNQRSLINVGTEEFTVISERLASTIYKSSEVMLANDDTDNAIIELLKIKKLTPDSPVRIISQYDASGLLMEKSRWGEAISELNELVSLYPEHELAPEFPRKLAFAYRSNEDWKNAAKAYLNLYNNDADPEIQREGLFVAAEMFENHKDYQSAIVHLTAYANTYPNPFDTVMEARYKLAVNHDRANDEKNHQYWLSQIIQANAQAGARSTDRSNWLSAWSHIQFADFYADAYRRIPLNLPLVKTLGKKKGALEVASQSYQKAVDFGHLEFVSMAGYKMSGLYSDLASSLRNSPIPSGLTAGDRETYTRIIAEQAQPLDALATDLLLSNVERAWEGSFNEWIDKSYARIAQLNPTRFAKQEKIVSYGDEIR